MVTESGFLTPCQSVGVGLKNHSSLRGNSLAGDLSWGGIALIAATVVGRLISGSGRWGVGGIAILVG